eukprot:1138503-Pelagomonas_calceolata.AAC.11
MLHVSWRATVTEKTHNPQVCETHLSLQEKQWGPDLPPKDKRVDPGPDADKMRHTDRSPSGRRKEKSTPAKRPRALRKGPSIFSELQEANKHAKGTAHVAETVSNQALKAVHAGEKARNFGQEVKNEVKELAQEPEPPPMAPEAALEKETMPQTGGSLCLRYIRGCFPNIKLCLDGEEALYLISEQRQFALGAHQEYTSNV